LPRSAIFSAFSGVRRRYALSEFTNVHLLRFMELPPLILGSIANQIRASIWEEFPPQMKSSRVVEAVNPPFLG